VKKEDKGPKILVADGDDTDDTDNTDEEAPSDDKESDDF
jgi:hypothetical protein